VFDDEQGKPYEVSISTDGVSDSQEKPNASEGKGKQEQAKGDL